MAKAISLFLITISLSTSFVNGQVIKEGTYIGYEKIDVFRHADGNLYFFPGVGIRTEARSLKDSSFYHQVVLTIKNDSAFLSKTPVLFANGQLLYSDSLGGFYKYVGNIVKLSNFMSGINVHLTYRKHYGHSSHGNPFYTMYSYYNIRFTDNGFIADVGNIKNVNYIKSD